MEATRLHRADSGSVVRQLVGSIGVAIVDDHRMFAECLARFLMDCDGIHVVGTAASGRDAIELVDEILPEVVLLDDDMPDCDGIEVAATIMRNHAEVSIIMMSDSATNDSIVHAVDAGCCGFLTKYEPAEAMADAVRGAALGGASISSSLLAELLPKLATTNRRSNLTPRELVALEHLERGWTNHAIAAEMGISTNTVRNFVQSILAKLGAHSKLEAVSVARREGILAHSL
ncbi:MAG: response regulator transcription factor [Ilumatobacteraceae bacterium]|nr:response regulator transcription factor [Ilumatobacteraceae bacterium]MCU1387715.1 response regulator transcription factor [Ilumatobacteraceae bacterium]